MTTTVYLAGPYSRRDQLAALAGELKLMGFEVTSRWLDGTHESDPALGGDSTEDDRRRWALEDLQDVDRSEVFVHVGRSALALAQFEGISGGRHVETGYALSNGSHVVLVGEPENVFAALADHQAATWHDAVVHLAAWQYAQLSAQPTDVDVRA